MIVYEHFFIITSHSPYPPNQKQSEYAIWKGYKIWKLQLGIKYENCQIWITIWKVTLLMEGLGEIILIIKN